MVFQIWSATDKSFCHFGPFLPFYPHNNPKKSKFWKTLKKSGDIIILHKCHKNHDHMLYCSLDMAHNECNYFSFWAIFCPFPPLTAWKMKIKKNEKKLLEILSFYKSVPKTMIRWCTVPKIWCVTGIIIFHFGPFLPFYPSNSLKNQNFEKMKKTPGNIIILHKSTKNYGQMMYSSWDMLRNRQTDRQKKWHIEVGAPPKSPYSGS